MAQFAGKTVVAIDHLTVDDDTGTHAGSQGDHDEILHAAGGAVGHFAHGGGVGIVGQGHRNAVHLLLEHLGKGNVAALGPQQVDGVLYHAGIEVAVGDAHADAADAAFCMAFRDDAGKGFRQGGHEFVCVGRVLGADDGLGDDVAAGIHHAAFGGLSAYVNSNY